MQVVTSERVRRNLLDERFRPLEIPSTLKAAPLGIDPDQDYTVRESVGFDGRTTFGGRKVHVEISPQAGQDFWISSRGVGGAARIENAHAGLRSIELLDEAQIIEHMVSIKPGLGVKAIVRMDQNCMPAFGACMEGALQAMLGKLKSEGDSCFYTVTESVFFKFDNGAYVVFEPDVGSRRLTIDHQFSHKKNLLGDQRVILEILPEVYAAICKARPMAYGMLSTLGWKLSNLRSQRDLPFSGLSQDNVVFVSKDEIRNPKPEFETPKTYIEPILHEVIDKLGAIALIPGRFVGTVTTNRTSHKQDLEAIRGLMQAGYVRFAG